MMLRMGSASFVCIPSWEIQPSERNIAPLVAAKLEPDEPEISLCQKCQGAVSPGAILCWSCISQLTTEQVVAVMKGAHQS